MSSIIKAGTEDITKGWVMDAYRGWAPDLVQKYCVQAADWQVIRLSMKGKPTHEKLQILLDWNNTQRKQMGFCSDVNEAADERLRCQVDNYLGALRRGGQLDDANMVRKFI